MDVMEINYNTEKGNGKYILSSELICDLSQRDLRKLLKTVDMSFDREDGIKSIYTMLNERIEKIKEMDKLSEKFVARETKRINGLKAILEKKYGNILNVEESKQQEIITVKVTIPIDDEPNVVETVEEIPKEKETLTTVHRVFRTDRACVQSFEGSTFEKDGFIFDIYSDSGKWIIMLHNTGMVVEQSETKEAAHEKITPRLINLFTLNADKISKARQELQELLADNELPF